MKKLLLFFFLSCPLLIIAQSFGNLTIFSENGDKFYLFLDGKKQNDIARSNIRVQQLPDLYYSAKIVFEDPAIIPITKNNLYISDDNDMLRDASYRLRRDKEGKPKLTFYSMNAIKENFVPDADMYVFIFNQPAVFEAVPVKEKKAPTSLLASSKLFASLHVFSQDNDKFFLFLDGIKQNDIAQADMLISNIPDLYYDVKIVFENSVLQPVIKNSLFVSDPDDNLMDATYKIRRDKQGKPKLNFYSMTAAKGKYIAAEGMYINSFVSSQGDAHLAVSTPASTDTISKTKTIKESNAAITALNTSTDKNISPSEGKKTVERSSTAPINGSNKTDLNKKQVVVMKENKKCDGWPMGKGDLASAKKVIEGVSGDEERLLAAKEIISSNCLLTTQVTEFCGLMKSEKSRLSLTKYSFQFTIDRKNYAEVSKVLLQENSKKELSKFINGN